MQLTLKKLFTTFVLVVLSFSTISISPTFATSTFKDVPESSYAYDAANWALQNDIVSGYKDKNGQLTGFFGPSDTVTEAHFAKMLANYFELDTPPGQLKKNTPAAHWSDEYYHRLAPYEVPLNGYFDNTTRNEPIKRGVVAQALAQLLYGPRTLSTSIENLLDDNISTGQNEQYKDTDLLKYFGSTNFLTRAQAITFLYRVDKMKEEKGEQKLAIEMQNFPNENITLQQQATLSVGDVDDSLNLAKYYDPNLNVEPLSDEKMEELFGNMLPPKYDPHQENGLTAILKPKLRENDTWKAMTEEGLESIYVYNEKEITVGPNVYSVHHYNPPYVSDMRLHSGEKYRVHAVYTVDLMSFMNDPNTHIQNLYDYGILTKKVDNEALKKFLISRFQVKEGEYIDESIGYNKQYGVLAYTNGRVSLSINRITIE